MRNFQIDGIEMAETAFDQNTCKRKKATNNFEKYTFYINQ